MNADYRGGHLPEFPDLHFEEPLEMGVEMTAVDLRFVVWFNEVEVGCWIASGVPKDFMIDAFSQARWFLVLSYDIVWRFNMFEPD